MSKSVKLALGAVAILAIVIIVGLGIAIETGAAQFAATVNI